MSNKQESRSTMLCPYCGQSLPAETRFCPSCGRTIARAGSRETSRPLYLGAMLGLLAALGLFVVVAVAAYAGLGRRAGQRQASPTWAPASAGTPAAAVLAQESSTPWRTATPTEPVTETATASWTPTLSATATLTPTATATWTPTPEPQPTCAVPADRELLPLQQGEGLGCAQQPARAVWTAWQPFERGAMLWRSDTRTVTVLYGNGTQETLADQWDGRAYSTGPAPAGKVAPTRGFGWIWASRPQVAEGLGWGLQPEKGFCAWLQEFEGGYAFRSTREPCSGEYNRANDADFAPLYIEVLRKGSWVRR